MLRVPTLKLVYERKIYDLMPCHQPTERWEASGLLVKDRHYFVVFDAHRSRRCSCCLWAPSEPHSCGLAARGVRFPSFSPEHEMS
jgi:hypothetical protein